MGFLVNWITKSVTPLLILSIDTVIAAINVNITNNGVIQAIVVALSGFAFIVFILSFTLSLIDLGIRKDRDLSEFVKSSIFAGIYAITFSTITFALFHFGTILSNQIALYLSKVNEYFNATQGLSSGDIVFKSLNAGLSDTLILMIAIVAAFIMMLMLIFQQFKRIVSLLVYQVVGILSIPALAKGNTDSFTVYLKSVIGLAVTQAVQVMLIYAAFICLSMTNLTGLPMFNIILFIAFLSVAIKASTYLKDWAHTTGTASSAATAGRAASQVYSTYRMTSMSTSIPR